MVYRVKEFAKLVGKSPSTLRRWEKEGKINPSRSVGNQRYYTDKDFPKALNIESKRLLAIKKCLTNVTKKKAEYSWMNQLSSRVYQNAIANLQIAFSRWRKGLGKAPTKKLKKYGQSFTVERNKIL